MCENSKMDIYPGQHSEQAPDDVAHPDRHDAALGVHGSDARPVHQGGPVLTLQERAGVQVYSKGPEIVGCGKGKRAFCGCHTIKKLSVNLTPFKLN